MGGCCDLTIYQAPDGELQCWKCRKKVEKNVKRGKESGRCVVTYSCLLCGDDVKCDCNTKLRVKTDGGDTTITCK